MNYLGRMLKQMLPWVKEETASDVAPGFWYPADPEIDKVLEAWAVTHPASHAGLRRSLEKYITLLLEGGRSEELKAIKEEQAFWWNEYQKDMKRSFAKTKRLLKY